MVTTMDLKSLLTERDALECRSLTCPNKWKVYFIEMKWESGRPREIFVFECLTCSAIRYLDASDVSPKIPVETALRLARLVGADPGDSIEQVIEQAVEALSASNKFLSGE
jgi:hypothetical protein